MAKLSKSIVLVGANAPRLLSAVSERPRGARGEGCDRPVGIAADAIGHVIIGNVMQTSADPR